MKVCSGNQGHKIKMDATLIFGKNHSKLFFSRTSGPIAVKLGNVHVALETRLGLCMGKSEFFSSERMIAYVFKVGRCI